MKSRRYTGAHRCPNKGHKGDLVKIMCRACPGGPSGEMALQQWGPCVGGMLDGCHWRLEVELPCPGNWDGCRITYAVQHGRK